MGFIVLRTFNHIKGEKVKLSTFYFLEVVGNILAQETQI
jgi:hypothetical protein